MSDLDDISCIIRAETGCNYASGDKAAVAVLAWMARRCDGIIRESLDTGEYERSLGQSIVARIRGGSEQ